MLEDPEASIAALCRKVKGPDFPTGGELVVDAGDLKQMYELGSGAVRVRGTWTTEQRGRKHYVVVDSIPYAVIKAKLVEEIGEHIRARKVPQIQDVRDESTDKVRVVLELRSPEDAEVAMAYLYKHTRLQAQFNVNLTALVPTDIVDGAQAERLDLRRILRHWLDFRFATVKRRLEFDLSELKARIHVLEGFAVIFDMLDEAIKIIRKSEGKRDAGEKLVARFGIDDLQADAILELKLYRLAKLEILVIREELAEKQAEADRIGKIIASRAKTWGVVKSELEEIRQQYGVSRKTRIAVGAPEIEYSADAYIVAEDAVVTLTRDGWLKRQGTVSTLDKVRVREGDTIGWAIRSTTTACFSAVSSAGTLYTIRVSDIPATTGYGEPIQKYFNFADGEKVVGAFGHDPRVQPADALRTPVAEGDPPPPHVVAVSRDGKVVRLPAESFAEPSNRNGRIAMRLEENGDHVVAAYLAGGAEHCCIASKEGNVLTFPVREIPPLRGAGKGVLAMKLDDDASVFAFELSADDKSGPTVVTALGREEVVTPSRYAGTRAARGRSLFKRGYFASWKRPVEAVMGKAISPAEGPGSGTGGEA
jgi:DNA gyrase subunit A